MLPDRVPVCGWWIRRQTGGPPAPDDAATSGRSGEPSEPGEPGQRGVHVCRDATLPGQGQGVESEQRDAEGRHLREVACCVYLGVETEVERGPGCLTGQPRQREQPEGGGGSWFAAEGVDLVCHPCGGGREVRGGGRRPLRHR